MGGFLFIYTAHLFRFAAQRLDGYKLLFGSAVAGTGLSILARCLVLIIASTAIGPWVHSRWYRFSPFEYSATGALSLVLGPVVALVLNLFVSKKRAKKIEVRRHASPLIQLLDRAAEERLLISVTLDSRKWYVGWVAESPNLNWQERYFKLLPYMSGYRDKDTLETFRTVFYEDVLTKTEFDADQFVITLRLDDIKIAGLFNENVYNEYFAELPEEKKDVSNAAATG